MALTAAQAKARKQRMTEEVKIPLDPQWARRLGEAQIRLRQVTAQAEARPSDTSLLDEMNAAAEEVEQLMSEADDNVLTVTFVGLPGETYERFVRMFPPTKEQRAQAAKDGRNVTFNEDTFPLAIVQRCWKAPREGWSDEDIAELFNPGEDGHEDDDDAPAGARWNSAELSALFYGAQAANAARHRVE